jgi:quercetin dioxygenase-like cupin family protein
VVEAVKKGGLFMADITKAELQQLSDASRDPVSTDGDKYKVVLENERVRVLEYRDSPGQRTSPHYHPAYVLCALSSFRRRLTLTDGREAVVEVRAGQVVWGNEQSHIGENIGDTDTHVLIVELKTS